MMTSAQNILTLAEVNDLDSQASKCLIPPNPCFIDLDEEGLLKHNRKWRKCW